MYRDNYNRGTKCEEMEKIAKSVKRDVDDTILVV